MKSKVEKGELYRLDEPYYKNSETTYLERIEFINEKVNYMILDGTILKNY